MVKGGGFHPAVGEAVLRKLREEEKSASGFEDYLEIPGLALSRPAAIYKSQGVLIDRHLKGNRTAQVPSYANTHIVWKKFSGLSRGALVDWQRSLLGTGAASLVSPNDEEYEQGSYENSRVKAAVSDAAKRLLADAQRPRQQLQDGQAQEIQGSSAAAVDSSTARKGMMSDNVSRHELDAKLELLNQKAEANVAKLSMEMQAFLKQQAERDKRNDERYAEFSARLADRDAMLGTVLMQSNKRLEDHEKVVGSSLDALKSEFNFVKNSVGAFDGKMTQATKSFRNTAFTVILAFLAIAATIVLGIWGANSTIVGSAQSLISGGRDIQKQEQNINEALMRNQQQVNDMQKKLEVKIEASDVTMREVLKFITRPTQVTPASQSEQTP